MPGFQGFPRGAEGFWHELATEMSREWFAAHKEEFEEQWAQPMAALLDDVRAAIAPSYRAIGLAPAKVFRIHRDVRFSKDKSPYKTHIAGVLSTGTAQHKGITEQAAALYVSFGHEEMAAAGMWSFSPEALTRWRKLLVDAKASREVAKLVDAARARHWPIVAGEALTRPPRGFTPDHPRIELALLKGLCVELPEIPHGLIYKPALAEWLAEQALTAAPLVRWLAKHIA